MFLRKILNSTFYKTINTYHMWLVYILLIFLFTNVCSSLDIINRYRFTWDMVLTFGFFAFLFIIEAFLISMILTIIQFALMKFPGIDISSLIKILLIGGLILALLNLLLMIFNHPIF